MLKAKIIFIFFIFFYFNFKAQFLSIAQITTMAFSSADKIEEILLKERWISSGLELNTDSNYVKKTWLIETQVSDIKNYVIHYEFIKDTGENYIIYQFADRKMYNNYQTELKANDFKQLNRGKARKRGRSKDKHIHQEKEYLYIHEKTKSLTVLKEVFYYGLNSFLIQSYKPKSAIAFHIIQSKDESK